jgi:hypothetical protein
VIFGRHSSTGYVGGRRFRRQSGGCLAYFVFTFQGAAVPSDGSNPQHFISFTRVVLSVCLSVVLEYYCVKMLP